MSNSGAPWPHPLSVRLSRIQNRTQVLPDPTHSTPACRRSKISQSRFCFAIQTLRLTQESKRRRTRGTRGAKNQITRKKKRTGHCFDDCDILYLLFYIWQEMLFTMMWFISTVNDHKQQQHNDRYFMGKKKVCLTLIRERLCFEKKKTAVCRGGSTKKILCAKPHKYVYDKENPRISRFRAKSGAGCDGWRIRVRLIELTVLRELIPSLSEFINLSLFDLQSKGHRQEYSRRKNFGRWMGDEFGEGWRRTTGKDSISS